MIPLKTEVQRAKYEEPLQVVESRLKGLVTTSPDRKCWNLPLQDYWYAGMSTAELTS